MARYKDYSYDQHKLIPVSYEEQILPGTFEHTLNYLIDHELDLSAFDGRYRNDDTGAPAYDPRILLKIILYAYSRGIVSSRAIERLCRENVVKANRPTPSPTSPPLVILWHRHMRKSWCCFARCSRITMNLGFSARRSLPSMD